MVLTRADGLSKKQTASKLQTSEVTVQRWTDRYRESGLDGLRERPRAGGSHRRAHPPPQRGPRPVRLEGGRAGQPEEDQLWRTLR
ncbi:MAG: helix-turn-helix domain-containing protein [Kiritimatiellae bacterium]|nr:helix-turn-helix domain-containing protein [Kiritimatiellia bacterium]